MPILVPFALFAWIPTVLLLFVVFQKRKAIIVAFLLAWLFLPMAGYPIEGLPDYTKMNATCVGILFATATFDSVRLVSFRPSWMDLPVIAFCLWPFACSIDNGFGPYDGASAVLNHGIAWACPYFIGRLYFRTLGDLRELAIGLFVGGLLYVPFCMYEIRMSPQLHQIVYGYHQHDFGQTRRFGGWRPMVFMQHGLMVGMWMCMTGLIGAWLWLSKSLRRLVGCPVKPIAICLILTALMCKSFGAITLLAGGLVVLLIIRTAGLSLPVWALILVAPVYMFARAGLSWYPQVPLEWVSAIAGDDRAASWLSRIETEDHFVYAAWAKPVFGWSRWSRAMDDSNDGSVIPDGLWTLVLVQEGFPGLIAFALVLLVPPLLFALRFPPHTWRMPEVAPAAALSIVTVLYMVDCLSNAMLNPVFMLAAGGVASVAASALIAKRTSAVSSVRTPTCHRLDASRNVSTCDSCPRLGKRTCSF
jgi:hypothetical protein